MLQKVIFWVDSVDNFDRGQYVTLAKKFLVCGSSIWVLNGWIIHFEVGHHQVAEGGVHRELPDTTTNLTVIHNLVNKPSTKDKILEPSRTPQLVIRRVEIETLPC